MLEMFYPDEYLDSTYSIDFEEGCIREDTEESYLILIIRWCPMGHRQMIGQRHCLRGCAAQDFSVV